MSSSLDSQRLSSVQLDGHRRYQDASRVSEALSPLILDDTISISSLRAPGQKSLTFVNGLALILGLQIGSGIFSAPSQVSNHVPSPGAAILIWLVSGILVWTGAASFIELGLAIPRNGGTQEYLKICYGDYLGFTFTWIYVVIAKPCAMAMIAMIFAENMGSAIVPTSILPVWEVKTLAIIGIVLITFINCLGTIAGARVANAFLILKLLAIFSIACTGITMGVMGFQNHESKPQWFASDPDPRRQTMVAWAKAGEYITAIYGALFCYGGWESVSISSLVLLNCAIMLTPTFASCR